MDEYTKNLKVLTETDGVSGFESMVTDEVIRQWTPFCDTVDTDTLGNVIGFKKGTGEKRRKIVLEAHVDEVGLIVTKVLPNGFLYFAPIGGIDPKILPAAVVTVHGKKPVTGVIGSKPPHLGEEENIYKELFIDTGMTNAQELVRVGDFVSFTEPTVALLGERVTAKCLDNRALVAMLTEVLSQMSSTEDDIYAVAAVGEELGERGAKAVSFRLQPDLVLVYDVTFGISHGASDGSFEIGKGVTIAVSADCDKALSQSLADTARENNIPFSFECCPEETGTDATVWQVSGNGTKTALISIPIRYMHTTCEVLDTKDVRAAIQLTLKWLQK